jgi:hypothetical protein
MATWSGDWDQRWRPKTNAPTAHCHYIRDLECTGTLAKAQSLHETISVNQGSHFHESTKAKLFSEVVELRHAPDQLCTSIPSLT